MRYTSVSDAEFAGLDGLDDWRLERGSIRARFHAGSFPDAGTMAARLAELAEEADHHPDIDIRYPDVVAVMLTTHETGGLTTHDVDLARRCSELAVSMGATAEH